MGQSDRDKIPQRIGRYEIQSSIGAGSMGAVYKGFDPLIKRTLAIKTIRLDIPRGSEEYRAFLERFYQEARISGTLSHPNIVTLYDIGEENGVPFLAMEFIDGETAESRIQRGDRFSGAQVVSLVRQLASAIDYAHSRSVVHRDVKPANLLLFERERIKITDFGIAKLADVNLTRVGQILGTPSYMSPEQATGQTLDGRTDIFSLGVCAFEMLSGVQPFPGDTVTSIVYKIVNADPVEPEDLEARGLLLPRWRATFARVLAKQPDKRYRTAAEFAADLESCVGQGAAAVVPAPAPPAVRTLPPRPRPAGDSTPTPRGTPVPASLSGDAAPDEPTVLMTAEEAAGEIETVEVARAAPSGSGPPTAEVSTEEIPTAQVDRPGASDEPPTVMMSAEEQSPDVVSPDVPTVLMGPSELGEGVPEVDDEATVVMAADEVADLAPTEPEGLAAAPRPAPAPPPVATRPPRPRVPDPPSAPPVSGPAASPPGPAPAGAPASSFPLKPILLVGVPVLLVLLVAGALGLRWLANRPPPLGSLNVETRPSGASISIDGELRGFSPARLDDVPAGSREVRLSLAGHREETRTVEVAAGGSERLSVDLTPLAVATTGTADFASQPEGATVSVDGEERGVTPLEGLELEAGEHEATLELSGYRTWTGAFEVEAGAAARVEAELERVPVRRATRSTPEPTPAPTPAPTPEPTPAPTPEPTPERPDPERVYSSSEVDQRPSRRRETPPTGLPRFERGQSVSITVAYVVDEMGRVIDVQTIDVESELLDAGAVETVQKALVEAIRDWEYEPARLQGQPVKYRYLRKFTYKSG